MAIAAWFLHAMNQHPVRLHWCVDLERDVGPHANVRIDPTNPDNDQTNWGVYLTRFRGALERQAWGPQRCRVALTVRYTSPETDGQVELTFDIPWTVNLAVLAKAAPPVGVWRLCSEPPGNGLNFEGDLIPDNFWMNGIPF